MGQRCLAAEASVRPLDWVVITRHSWGGGVGRRAGEGDQDGGEGQESKEGGKKGEAVYDFQEGGEGEESWREWTAKRQEGG